jgi:hypothetical protein
MGSTVSYFLKTAPSGRGGVDRDGADKNGKTVREIRNPPAVAGLNRVAWDLRWDPPVEPPQWARKRLGRAADRCAGAGRRVVEVEVGRREGEEQATAPAAEGATRC